jgi:hypothetical protein
LAVHFLYGAYRRWDCTQLELVVMTDTDQQRSRRLFQKPQMGFWLLVAMATLWMFVFASAYNRPVLHPPRHAQVREEILTNKKASEANQVPASRLARDQATEDKKSTTDTPPGTWGALFDVKFTDYLLTLFTFAITVFTWLQYRANKILQRAYLAVEPLGVETIPQEGVLGYVGISNVGNLPARKVRWCLYIECDNDKERKHFPVFDVDVDGNNVVPPGTVMRRGSKAIPSHELLLFHPETEKFCFIWGTIRYTDGFGKERFTDFCHRYNCEAITAAKEIPESTARYHEHGNNAD